MLIFYLLLLQSQNFTRIPQKSSPPEITTTRVWVFFTDKGIFNQSQYQLAIDQIKNRAPVVQLKRRQKEKIRDFDFDDLPVNYEYIRQIEQLGARVRTVSNWLNAASFEMPPALVPVVYQLPFVYDIKPVALRTEHQFAQTVPLTQPTPYKAAEKIDTADARRFYGASWDQAQMLGVPEIFFQGYFGTGVKLAIFDTGLKLKNQAVKNLKIYRQYDFISGDNFYISQNHTTPQPISTLAYLGMVKDPALITHNNRTILVFVADSFNYLYGLPARAIFYSTSHDRGATWSFPRAIILSRPYFYTYENLQMASRDSITYLVFNELNLNPGAQSTCYLGYFTNTTWHQHQTVATGKQPAIVIHADTLNFVCLRSDSVLTFRRASISQSTPIWLLTSTVVTDEPISSPQLATGPGVINLIAHTKGTNRIAHWRSTDGGYNFIRLTDIIPEYAVQPRVFQIRNRDSVQLLIYQDHTRFPLIRLNLCRSFDYGTTWLPPVTIDSGLNFTDYSLSFANHKLKVVYRSAGLIHSKESPDLGLTWQNHTILDSTGFACAPLLAEDQSFCIWYRRGDEIAIWEEADTVRFSRDQPNHGTRMASIIAGYQPYSMMGIAPGVDLLIAKTEYYKTASNRSYEYNMEEDTYIQALEWAERWGADIVSTSLGYRGWYSDEQLDGRTAPVSIAADLAAKRGMLIVTAMGNRDTTEYPWPRPYIVAPGDAENVITCGGVQKNLTPWRGTGTGPTADGRVKPDLVALSDTVAVAAPDSVNFLEGSVGTSCATALIAGCCALLKEAHPDWSADSIKAVLYSTATRPVKSCTFGFGVPRVDSAFKLFPPSKQSPPIQHNEIGLIYPNPFITPENPKVYFSLNLNRVTPNATITIYTASGTKVKTIRLNTSRMNAIGRYQDKQQLEEIGAWWDGRNEIGRLSGTGLYLAVLETTFGRSIAKFALIRRS